MSLGVFFNRETEKIFGGVLELEIVASVAVHVYHLPIVADEVHSVCDLVGYCPEYIASTSCEVLGAYHDFIESVIFGDGS
jgi:hypothetical protein